MTPLQTAVAEYAEKEPAWMQSGGCPRALMEKVATDHGLTFGDLCGAILDHFDLMGAG